MIELLNAYERGINDGFFEGNMQELGEGVSDECRVAYIRGYAHGVWMYSESLEGLTTQS